MIIKKCRHHDVAVKCEYKDWVFIADKGKAVRRCTYNGVCARVDDGGGIKNGEGGRGEKLLHR